MCYASRSVIPADDTIKGIDFWIFEIATDKSPAINAGETILYKFGSTGTQIFPLTKK